MSSASGSPNQHWWFLVDSLATRDFKNCLRELQRRHWRLVRCYRLNAKHKSEEGAHVFESEQIITNNSSNHFPWIILLEVCVAINVINLRHTWSRHRYSVDVLNRMILGTVVSHTNPMWPTNIRCKKPKVRQKESFHSVRFPGSTFPSFIRRLFALAFLFSMLILVITKLLKWIILHYPSQSLRNRLFLRQTPHLAREPAGFFCPLFRIDNGTLHIMKTNIDISLGINGGET